MHGWYLVWKYMLVWGGTLCGSVYEYGVATYVEVCVGLGWHLMWKTWCLSCPCSWDPCCYINVHSCKGESTLLTDLDSILYVVFSSYMSIPSTVYR